MSPLRRTQTAFVAAIVLLLLSGTVATLFIIRFIETEHWVVHTLQVQSALGDVSSAVSSLGRARLRYANTGDQEFVKAFIQARNEPEKTIQHVQELTSDNREQQELIARLREITKKRIALYEKSIDLTHLSPGDKDGQNQITMDGITLSYEAAEITQRMRDNEQHLLAKRVAHAQRLLSFSILALGTTFLLTLVFLVLHYGLLRRELGARLRAENDLQLRNIQLEEASRVKSEFLANMSHEIRTPMNGIIGMTELALDTELTSDQRQYLDMVKQCADSLLILINDILDFSKIEAGKLDLELIEFNIRSLAEDTSRMLGVQAHRKSLELITEVEPGVPDMLIGDPVRLRQILLNLLSNALKFTEQGEIVLNVKADEESPEAIGIHLSVSDTGIGIPIERQQSIFEAFAQADTSTARKFGGTGLGLTITSRLVGLMGGRIWVESEPGKGSTFHCLAKFGLAKKTAAVESKMPVDLKDTPVLIVDDNETSRRILKQMLLKWQMKPTLADGALNALAILQDAHRSGQAFPLVITDMNMPDINGFGLAERINQDPALAGVTIMMLTSVGQRGESVRCRELGMKAYLLKPVRPSELRAAIIASLSNSGSQIESRQIVTRHSLREAQRRLRVLLAEDNRVNQILAKRLLEQKGHTVSLAGNGLEVLEQLETSRFDVVLMDVQMPEMDGFETTRIIREKEQSSGDHLPIIALTAHAMAGDQNRCLVAGMDLYLTKPLQSSELFAAIERSQSIQEIRPKALLHV